MTLEEIETLAARWGADVAVWPAGSRDAARRALDGSAEARETLALLAAMESELAEARRAPLSDELTSRILADAASAAPTSSPIPERSGADATATGMTGFLDRILPLWRPAAACAASVIAGIWIGYLSPDSVANAATSIALLENGAGFSGVVPGDVAGMDFDLAYAAPEATR